MFAGDDPLQRCKSLGALQGQQGAVVQVIDRYLIGQVLTQVTDIVPLGCAVYDQIEAVAPTRDHQVIQHAAILIQQERIARAMGLQRRQIDRQYGFKRGFHALTRNVELAHMADIEQPGAFPRPEVFGDDPFVLDGHPVSGEFDHPPVTGPVPGIERQGEHFGLSRFFVIDWMDVAHSSTPHRNAPKPVPPLSRKPESFPRSLTGLPLRRPHQVGHFPEYRYRPTRSLVPERFRGGCSFGARRNVMRRIDGTLPRDQRYNCDGGSRRGSQSRPFGPSPKCASVCLACGAQDRFVFKHEPPRRLFLGQADDRLGHCFRRD